jgi:hypothetical protein
MYSMIGGWVGGRLGVSYVCISVSFILSYNIHTHTHTPFLFFI